MISECTRDKIAGARRRGKWTGGPVPFGYSVTEKKLIINEVEAHVVREAFKLFLEHRQMAAVARLLTEKGLLPRGMAGRPAKGGLRWRKEAIARLLRSPLYVGQMMYGDELAPFTWSRLRRRVEHARLIDDATFEFAQRILAGKEGPFRQAGINPDYVLRGLLRCKRCNTQMCPGSTKKGKTAYRYYRCATRDKHGPKACSARPIPAEALEDFVAERISAAVAQPDFVARLERSFKAQATSRKVALHQVLAGLPAQIARFAAQVNALTEQAHRRSGHARDLVEAKLGVEAERLLAAEKQLTQTECEFKALSAAETESAWVTSSLRDFTTLWGAMLPENRGRLLRALVAEVRVDEAENLLEVELLNLTGTALMGTAENAA